MLVNVIFKLKEFKITVFTYEFSTKLKKENPKNDSKLNCKVGCGVALSKWRIN